MDPLLQAALDARRARSLAEAGLDELCVSVHGFEAATYERVMAGLSFARLERNLDQVFEAAAREELGAMTVQIVTGDVPEITDTRDLAPLHYRDRIVLKAFSNRERISGQRARSCCPKSGAPSFRSNSS